MNQLKPGTPDQACMNSDRVALAEDYTRKLAEDATVSAAVILTARNGIVFSKKAYGRLIHDDSGSCITTDAIFPVASISKTVVATCIMVLVEQGLVDITQKVGRFLPEFRKDPLKDLQVYHFVTHTSGLTDECIGLHRAQVDEDFNPSLVPANQHPFIYKKLQAIYRSTPVWKPLEFMSYCNNGYEVLAEIIRVVTGLSLSEFADKHLFQPLGMKDTHFVLPEEKRSRVVHRPDDFDGGSWFNDPVHAILPTASGGLYSTVSDMGIWGQMYLNKGCYGNIRILSRPTVTEITKDQIPDVPAKWDGEGFKKSLWGYGWNIRGTKKDDSGTICSELTYSQSGLGGAFIWIDPAYNLVGVFFSTVRKQIEPWVPKKHHNRFVNIITSAVSD